MIGDSCKTVGGSSPYKPCILPFIWSGDGSSHTKCTQVDGDDTPWCATHVNENGENLSWGYCAPDCPFEP